MYPNVRVYLWEGRVTLEFPRVMTGAVSDNFGKCPITMPEVGILSLKTVVLSKSKVAIGKILENEGV